MSVNRSHRKTSQGLNYRQSRARKIVENSLKILVQRWRILRRPFSAKEETTDRILAVCMVFHSFVMKHSEVSERRYVPPGFVDGEGQEGELVKEQWRSEQEAFGLLEVPPQGTRFTEYVHSMLVCKLASHSCFFFVKFQPSLKHSGLLISMLCDRWQSAMIGRVP